jgi:hypothetical protein
MPTLWEHQVHVIALAQAMPGAIAALDIAFPCDDGATRDAAHPEWYSCKLSSNGLEPVTHYGSSFVVTEAIRARLESMGLAQTLGIAYWRCGNPDEILHASNYPDQTTGILWNFDTSVSVMGLQRVQAEYPA